MDTALPQATLENLRNAIDTLDKDIQLLIIERAKKAIQIGELKKQITGDSPFYSPEREALVLRTVMERDCYPLSTKEMANIFRAIMSACLALQKPLSIAFLGPLGTFSEIAALQHFGPSIHLVPTPSISNVFEQVESKQVNFGVVPIENSIGGIISSTIEGLIEYQLLICGEICLSIHQNLMVPPHYQGEIKKIYAHEQSLLQCKKWLKDHYPTAEQIPVVSNAYAAQLVSQETFTAAIGGENAAHRYQLKIIAKNIEDASDNLTRFLVIGHHASLPCGEDRTSLLVTIPNSPGALEKLIRPFSQNNLNLTLIKSQPSLKQKGNYLFFLDIDIHRNEESFQLTLNTLQEQNMTVKILGSYPKAVF